MNALVTGGTKGIGKAICESLLKEGINVAFCSRTQEDLDRCKSDWSSRFPKADILAIKCDMSSKQEIGLLSRIVLEKWNHVDILVNNAGIFIPGEIINEEEGVLEEMIQVNLMSAYHLTRLIAPKMILRAQGYIFNMCSIASRIAYPNGGSYSISKFALLGFSKVLREELKGKGIKVTSILPGATWSNSWKGVDLPVERLMLAEDVAEAVLSAINMSPSAVVEEIVMRPQLGDL